MERYTSRPDAYFVKSNVEPHESFMHKYIYNLKIDGINMPRLVTYNKKTSQLVMANIDGMSVSDMYGENIEDTPDDVFEKIREILVKLVDNGIEYPDFTGYKYISCPRFTAYKYYRIYFIPRFHMDACRCSSDHDIRKSALAVVVVTLRSNCHFKNTAI